jgi:hypothetical protein
MAYNYHHERFPSTKSMGKGASTGFGGVQSNKRLPKEAHEKLHMDVEEVKRMPAFLLKTLRADQ